MSIKKLSTLILLLILLTFATNSVAQAARVNENPRLDTESIDASIQEAMQAVNIPGASVGIVQNGEIVYMQGYGIARPDGTAVTPQTPFMLASVSKCFTALAILQLVNQGKVDMSASILTYLPDLQIVNQDALEKITIRNLIEHSSGFSTADGNRVEFFNPTLSRDELIAKLSTVRLNRAVGSSYEYSNINYWILGKVVEQASGMTFEEYVQQNILDPLDMKNTYFSKDEAIQHGMASTYHILFGYALPYDEPYVKAQMSGGYIISSAEDMAHLLIAYVSQGKYGETQIVEPNLATYKDQPGWFTPYWEWTLGSPIQSTVYQSGALTGANTDLVIMPGEKIGVILLFNTNPSARVVDALSAMQVADNIARLVAGYSATPIDDGGFSAYYGQANRTYGILLGFALFEIGALVFWFIRWNPRKGWQTAVILLFALLDLSLCLYGLVYYPISQQLTWAELFTYTPDYNGLIFAEACLFGIAGVGKLILVTIMKKTKLNRPS